MLYICICMHLEPSLIDEQDSVCIDGVMFSCVCVYHDVQMYVYACINAYVCVSIEEGRQRRWVGVSSRLKTRRSDNTHTFSRAYPLPRVPIIHTYAHTYIHNILTRTRFQCFSNTNQQQNTTIPNQHTHPKTKPNQREKKKHPSTRKPITLHCQIPFSLNSCSPTSLPPPSPCLFSLHPPHS